MKLESNEFIHFPKTPIEYLLSPGREIRNILMEGARDLRGRFCVAVAGENISVGESQSHGGTVPRPGSQREGGLTSGI